MNKISVHKEKDGPQDSILGPTLSNIIYDGVLRYFLLHRRFDLRYIVLSVIIVVADCRHRCWGTAVFFFLFKNRGRKIGLRAPVFEPGSRTFVT